MASRTEYLQVRLTPDEKSELERLAERSGLDMSTYVRRRALPDSARRIRALVGVLADRPEDLRFALAELNDVLVALSPGRFGEALEGVDVSGLSDYLQNYVAAMVEMAAEGKGEKRVKVPAWVGAVRPLARPHFVVPMAGLRRHLLAGSPVPFKRRNIFVDSSVGARV